jgi:NADP-dependent 3-hydroxy acid dehydrogenase YdfG
MTDQVWFVTGSSRGLGRSVAEEALAAGRKVVATARRASALDDLAERYADRLLAVRLDVTDPEPPLHLVLGRAAVDNMARVMRDTLAADERWAPAGRSVDFD